MLHARLMCAHYVINKIESANLRRSRGIRFRRDVEAGLAGSHADGNGTTV